ncbi:glycosyltransferase family 2 protein [Gracilimonas sp. Q87]|uniref:glycosyltransferase family 2 protein n=1 Tax=Gracilimonas sp. Q87 TaxID=3384766 RepID=UPI003983DF5E
MAEIKEILQQFVNFMDPAEWVFIGYFLVVNLTYIMLVIISFFYIRQQQNYYQVFNLKGLFNSNLYKPVSILSPAYNEEVNIIASVEALLQLHFSDFEVVVINDGSTDSTLKLLLDYFELYEIDKPVDLPIEHKPIKKVYRSAIYPELKVVDKENGGKADALNTGINVASKDLVCSIDADSILEPDVLLKLLKAFMEEENVVAVGGIVRIANGCTIEDNIVKKVDLPKSYLGRIQTVEYLRSFLFGRVGWDYLDSLLIISGAFGVFDKKAVVEVGGYLDDTVGEDMELVVRLHRYFKERGEKYSVRFLPEPVCWTEVPESWSVLGRQRNRWQRGLADTMMRHKKMLLNPKYGRLGMLAMPYFFFIEMLGPVVELFGFAYFLIALFLGGFNSTFVLLFLTASVFLGMVLSVTSVLCEELSFRRYPTLGNIANLTLYAFLENVGYRQIHTWWRFKGLVDYVKGDKGWGVMTRTGLTSKTNVNKGLKRIKESVSNLLGSLKYWVVVYGVTLIVIVLILHVLIDNGIIPDVYSMIRSELGI